jgi:hypothetical protein
MGGLMLSQISPPMRIALLAALVFGVVWFVALRPGGASDEEPLPVAPGVEGLSNGVEQAREAQEVADAAAAASQDTAAAVESGADAGGAETSSGESSASAATSTSSSTATATGSGGSAGTGADGSGAPAAASTGTGPAAPLVAALRRNRIVVLVFRNRSSDSEAVAAAARGVNRRGGRVVVRVASVSDVGRYRAFTGRTQVNQAPTTLVIGPTRRAQVITGFTTTGEISQAVGDLRAAARRAAAS